MYKWKSIKSKLIVYTLLSCILPLILGSIYIKVNLQKGLFSKNIEEATSLLEQTGKHVDAVVVDQTQQLIRLMNQEPRLTSIGDDIRSYVDYDGMGSENPPSFGEKELMLYFEKVKESFPYLTLVSYGTEFGGYIEYPEFKPTAPYDPRIRPWYIGAIKSKEMIVSEPYKTSVSKELVMSIDQALYKDSKALGVLSLTIRLEDIVNSVNDISLGKTGEILVVSPEGNFINSPSHKDWMLDSVDDIDYPLFRSILETDSPYYEGLVDGERRVFCKYVSPLSGWTYISMINKDEVLSDSEQMFTMMLFSVCLTIFLVGLMLVIVSKRIADPIVEITNTMIKISKFDFDSEDENLMHLDMNSRDEIGRIAGAMRILEVNFLELKSGLKGMAGKIKAIRVQEGSVEFLQLSEGNPFKSVVDSINILLGKVQEYLNQIRAFNHEILEKNELLVASEEELSAQLEEIQSQKQMIQLLAEEDPLTGLPNRRQFYNDVKSNLDANEQFAIFLMDIDNFKDINDTLGHVFGDKVLVCFSEVLRTFESDQIKVSRFGGDEFLIIYRNFEDESILRSFAEGLFKAFEGTFKIDQHEITINFSVGISIVPENCDECESFIRYADIALYYAKAMGKHSFAFFDKFMEDAVKARLKIYSVLKAAIEEDGFHILYQPQVNLSNGHVIGFEALLRLKHHDYSPSEFIEIAEKEDLIIKIGRIVTESVIKQLVIWRQEEVTLKPVSINFSVGQLKDKTYKDFLSMLLKKYDISNHLIVIEVTETVFIENKAEALKFFNELSEIGVKIAIDDFGSKYSSLYYLKSFSASVLKFDRQLCMHILEHYDDKSLSQLVSFIHSLNLSVVAEGIEESSHVMKFINSGCDSVQGFYFSKPVSPDQINLLIEETFDLPEIETIF